MGCDGSRRRCVRQLARRRRRGSQQAVVGATNSNPTERGQVQYRDVGEKREVPIAVGDVHGELDVVRDGVGDAHEILADILLRLAVGDIESPRAGTGHATPAPVAASSPSSLVRCREPAGGQVAARTVATRTGPPVRAAPRLHVHRGRTEAARGLAPSTVNSRCLRRCSVSGGLSCFAMVDYRSDRPAGRCIRPGESADGTPSSAANSPSPKWLP